MDPYLESPDLWPDFHHRLAFAISDELNRLLPTAYYAQLEMRQELGIIEEGHVRHRIIPDLTMIQPRMRHPERTTAGGTALLERPRRDLSKSVEFTVVIDSISHHFVEIRDSRRGHKLITLIEILSPLNKRPGADRDAYRAKQSKVLGSDANLIEIDLLRDGKHVLPDLSLSALVAQLSPPADQLVMVSRA
jgi:hypothetical protein